MVMLLATGACVESSTDRAFGRPARVWLAPTSMRQPRPARLTVVYFSFRLASPREEMCGASGCVSLAAPAHGMERARRNPFVEDQCASRRGKRAAERMSVWKEANEPLRQINPARSCDVVQISKTLPWV